MAAAATGTTTQYARRIAVHLWNKFDGATWIMFLIHAGKPTSNLNGGRVNPHAAAFVMPGLDPDIRAPQAVDCRVKPRQ